MFILATEVQQNIEQNVEELDKKVSRLSTVIDDGINKAIDFGFDLFLAIVIFIIGRIVLSLVRKLFKKIMNRSNIDEGVVKFLDSMIKVFGYIVIIITICADWYSDNLIYHSFRYSRSFHRFGITGKSCKLCRRYTYTYN